MKMIIDMANGAVAGLVLKTYLMAHRSSTAARPMRSQKRNAFR